MLIRKLKTILLLLLCFSAKYAKAQLTFVDPTPTLTVCQNSAATSISTFLTVNADTAGATLTWTVVTLPSNGTLSGFPAIVTPAATAGNIPSGVTYQPAPLYSGADNFSIQVSDGTTSVTVAVSVIVNPLPTINPTPSSACTDVTTNFSATPIGGTWSSASPGVTVISATGAVTGTSGGNKIITYTFNTCTSTRSISISNTPTVNGTTSVCIGSTVALTGTPTSGNWSSLFPAVATVNTSGLVSGIASGTADIVYDLAGCRDTAVVTVNPLPSPTTGTTDVCMRLSTLLSNATLGIGTWTSLNTTIATINSGTGLVTALNNAGTANIIYRSNLGCDDTTTVTVKPTPIVLVSGFAPSSVNQTNCNGDTVGAFIFQSNIGGANFQYSALNGDTSIFKPNSIFSYNTGNTSYFPAYRAVNATNFRDSSTIIVKASFNGCSSDLDTTFKLRVNPTPRVNPTTDININCSNLFSPVVFTGTSDLAITSYEWTNNNTTIGLSSTGTNTIGSFTALNTLSSNNTATIVVTPKIGACIDTTTRDTFLITVTAVPTLTSVSSDSVCNGLIFNYVPTSPTATIYNWFRDTTSGISNPATFGTGDPSETLINTTPSPVAVAYVYTITASGCSNTDTVNVTVFPTPRLSSTTDTSVCDGILLNYIPTSATNYSTLNYTWTRASLADINDATSSGTSGSSSINGTPLGISLDNTSNDSVHVRYNFEVTSLTGGCVGRDTVNVVVYPTPGLKLSELNYPIMCNKTAIDFPLIDSTITSKSYGLFTWSRSAVIGIFNDSTGGNDTINETLNDTLDIPVAATYTVSITAVYPDSLKCSSTTNVTVTVNPTPRLLSPLVDSICNNTLLTYVPITTTGTVVDSVIWRRINIDPNITSTNQVRGVDTIKNTLTNNTDSFRYTQYNYLLYTHTDYVPVCAIYSNDTQKVSVLVMPTPKINNHVSIAQCDGLMLKDSVTSPTEGLLTYTWVREPSSFITPAPGASVASKNINEVLYNADSIPHTVVYDYSLILKADTFNCPSIVAANKITDTVNPTPRLKKSYDYKEYCSGTAFDYEPISITDLSGDSTQYTWKVDTLNLRFMNNFPNTSPDTLSDGKINFIISSEFYQKPLALQFFYILNHRGCTSDSTVTIRVRPTPEKPRLAKLEDKICYKSNYVNMYIEKNTNIPSDSVVYTWKAVGDLADIIAGDKGIYAQVSFTKPAGTGGIIIKNEAYIIYNGESFIDCIVDVDTAIFYDNDTLADTSNTTIAYNDKTKLFFYLNSVIDTNYGYVWGITDLKTQQDIDDIDQAVNNPLRGKTQVHEYSNKENINPLNEYATTKRYYVKTLSRANGCIQKSYWKPESPKFVAAKPSGMSILVYPNPAETNITIELSDKEIKNATIEVFDVVNSRKVFIGDMPQYTFQLPVSDLHSGNYIVVCSQNGMKLATTQFVKK